MENQLTGTRKYKSIYEFMDQPMDKIKLALLADINPGHLGLIRQIISCDTVETLAPLVWEHFHTFSGNLFNLGINVKPIGGYRNGLCAVKDLFTNKVGFMDNHFNMEIHAIYDSVNDFNHEHFAVVEYGNKVGLIDDSGSWIIKPDYKEIIVTKECMQYICNDGMDLYMHELDKDRIMGDPYEMQRFHTKEESKMIEVRYGINPFDTHGMMRQVENYARLLRR